VATDKALVTTLSPNGNQLTDTQLRATPVPVSDGGGSVTVDGSVSVSNFPAFPAVQPVNDNGGSLTVDGPLTDAQLRATAVPISAASLPLPAGAATAALQTQPGVDIGDVTVNNAAGAAAVNIQDGGNSITVDATSLPLPTGAATEATLATRVADATVTARLGTLGQKTMAGSTPVVVASDQSDLDVVLKDASGNAVGVVDDAGAYRLQTQAHVQTNAESGWYPDPSVREVSTDGHVSSDVSGSLRTRGPVLTDEASFRDDFSGSTLFPTRTGTIAVTNGVAEVVGTGTLFTTEIKSGCYIRLGAHGEGALTQVDYVVDDTNLVLVEGYLGATGSGAFVHGGWHTSTGSGGSIGVSSSEVAIANGSGAGAVTGITRSGDYLPFAAIFHGRLSQRVANQTTRVGVTDDPTGAPETYAGFAFTGTDNTKVTCESAFASDSVETTTISLPAGTTAVDHQYKVIVLPSEVLFSVDNKLVASHRRHVPDPYANLSFGAVIINTGAVGSVTTLTLDAVFFKNVNQLVINSISRADALPVQGVVGGTPIPVQFSSGVGASLPYMINLVYRQSLGALVANQWLRLMNYTIPTGFSAYIIRFSSFQDEAAISRMVASISLGTHNANTNVFAAGSAYVTPQWASVIEAVVTTAFAGGGGNVTLTVTYTNQNAVGGRTGTFTIPKGSVVETRWPLTLQAGDMGVQSIQAISASPTQVGIVAVHGQIRLAYHQDQSTTLQTKTEYAPGAISFPAGTVLGFAFAGGTVSKMRDFDALIQLVPT
jgi:hypothetical protein